VGRTLGDKLREVTPEEYAQLVQIFMTRRWRWGQLGANSYKSRISCYRGKIQGTPARIGVIKEKADGCFFNNPDWLAALFAALGIEAARARELADRIADSNASVRALRVFGWCGSCSGNRPLHIDRRRQRREHHQERRPVFAPTVAADRNTFDQSGAIDEGIACFLASSNRCGTGRTPIQDILREGYFKYYYHLDNENIIVSYIRRSSRDAFDSNPTVFLGQRYLVDYFSCQFTALNGQWKLEESICFSETEGPFEPNPDVG
jgi:hypothetical protein